MTDVKAQDKAERLKAALRENLKRRKVQARERQSVKSPGNESDSLSVLAERDKPSD